MPDSDLTENCQKCLDKLFFFVIFVSDGSSCQSYINILDNIIIYIYKEYGNNIIKNGNTVFGRLSSTIGC